MCIVPLLPFPAFIFYGFLKNSVDLILLICYICLSIGIFVEVRNRVNSMSASTQKYHLKVLKDIVQQIIIKLITFIFYPFLTCCLYFVTPETNSISKILSSILISNPILGLTMIIYNIFVAAPIPGTVALILQTPSYRQYLMRTLTSRVESF
uniref:Serpentine Receptor, class H n=1 Tax=Caenorhabditis tropicalis TaxID=1561998 RepID=A0A1I7TPU9_9PELO